jgi:hypothetical protein
MEETNSQSTPKTRPMNGQTMYFHTTPHPLTQILFIYPPLGFLLNQVATTLTHPNMLLEIHVWYI